MYDEYNLTNCRDVSMEILANPSSSRTSSPFDSQNEDFNVQIEQDSDYVFGNSLDFSDEFDSQTETSLLEDHSDDASGVSDEEHAENDDDLDIEECEAAVRGPAMFQNTVVELKSDGRLLLDGACRLTFTPQQVTKAREAGVDKCQLTLDTNGYI
jgi:hypothetical protein